VEGDVAQFTVDVDAETKAGFEAAFANHDLNAVVAGLLRQATLEKSADAASIARRQAAVEAVLNGQAG
jgi:hypothetical protein